VTSTKEKSKSASLASLSPSQAWTLLTPTEQQLITDYLIKVLEQEVKQNEKRKLAMANA
jgi:hypothetical protein